MGLVNATRCLVDLTRFRSNIAAIRQKLPTRIKLLVVVKSDAYGHGLVKIGKEVQSTGVNWLGVASLAEARKLREAGVNTQIFLLGSWLPEQAEEIIRLDITSSISTLEEIRRLEKEAKRQNNTCAVHIRVDTGMGRGGFRAEEVQPFIKKVKNFKSVSVEGIFSHLSSAYSMTKSAREFTLNQIGLFSKLTNELTASSSLPPLVHLGASEALVYYPEAVTKPPLNLVRVGQLAYGVNATLNQSWEPKLKQIKKISTRVVARYRLQPGQYLSYGGTYQARRPTEVALLPVGYGQGLDLKLSNRGSVAIDGQLAPIIGEVCMNETAVNVTKLDNVQVGDTAEILGDQVTLTQMSNWAGTGECEILMGLSKMGTKLYFD